MCTHNNTVAWELPYLDNWEKSVTERDGYKRCWDYRWQVNNTIYLCSYILLQLIHSSLWWSIHFPPSSKKEACISEQQLMSGLIFGCQTQQGGISDKPNVLEFCQCTQVLGVIDSFCRGPVRGNYMQRHTNIDWQRTLLPYKKDLHSISNVPC